MKWNKVQLLVYGTDLDDVNVQFDDDKIKVLKVHDIPSTDYAFVDIEIPADIEPGDYTITFEQNGEEVEKEYSILEREFDPASHRGFSNEDVVYLIFPDRFNNGDPSNDTLEVSSDEFKYKSLNGRHGGDLQGIIDKLDYLADLGITAIWLTPTLENKMHMSYHGYAATDLYNKDVRFGSNELYKEMVSSSL